MIHWCIVLNIILCWFCNTIDSQSCYSHIQLLPIPMYGHIAIYSDISNGVYLFGGLSTNAAKLTNIYKWDLNTPNAWFQPIGTTPTTEFVSYGNNGVLLNDTIYFIGVEEVSLTSGNIYLYHIPTESWLPSTQLTAPPVPLSHGCLTSNGTHIFMVDGFNGQGNVSRSVYLQIYDVATDAWTAWNLASATGGYRYQYCSMVNNELFIFGGRLDDPGYTSVIYKWEVIKEEWSSIGYLPSTQSWGVAVYYKDLIYIVGSYPYTVNISIFNATTETLSDAVYTMTQELSAPASLVLNNKLYIFGGEDNGFNALSNVEICDLPNTTTITTMLPAFDTNNPTKSPTRNPTSHPTDYPTNYPTNHPTNHPTNYATFNPSKYPTSHPTKNPTKMATNNPTSDPTNHLTSSPSRHPTYNPTKNPTKLTIQPTRYPISTSTKITSSTNLPHDSTTNRPTTNTINPTESPTMNPTRTNKALQMTPTTSPTSSTIKDGEVMDDDDDDNDNKNIEHNKEAPNNAKEDNSFLILGIIGVVILCLILIFCGLIYMKLRKSSDAEKDMKQLADIDSPSDMHSVSSPTPGIYRITSIASTSRTTNTMKHKHTDTVELETYDDGTSTNPNIDDHEDVDVVTPGNDEIIITTAGNEDDNPNEGAMSMGMETYEITVNDEGNEPYVTPGGGPSMQT